MWAWTPPCSAPDDPAIVKTSQHWLRPFRCQKSHLIWRVFCTCSINQVLSRSCLHRCQSGDPFDRRRAPNCSLTGESDVCLIHCCLRLPELWQSRTLPLIACSTNGWQ